MNPGTWNLISTGEWPKMTFNPKFTITPKINKALVEIECWRRFIYAVKPRLNSGLILAENGIFKYLSSKAVIIEYG